MAEPARAPSLTGRLTVAIALVLLAGAIAVTLAALAFGQRAARDAYDRLLIGAATQIAAGITVEDGAPAIAIPVAAFELLALAPDDRIFWRVSTAEGATLTGYDELPLPPDANTRFWRAEFRGAPVRLAVVQRQISERGFSGQIDVIVGHTMTARRQLARQIVGSALAILAVAGLAMAGLAAFAVRSALRPLRRIEADLLARDPRDLTPLAIAAPRELAASVSAINRFMSRLDRQVGVMQRLIADSAHQLRTPVAAIRAQAELAAAEPDGDRRQQIVARIHDRSVGLSRLTDQLLNRALVIHRADTAPRDRVDLRQAAIRAAEETDPVATEAAPALRLDLAVDAVAVTGDLLSLTEAAKNLINNAFAHGKSPVALRVHAEGAAAILSVEDAGSGMSDTHLARAGRRFSEVAAGGGLGLSIVQAVATAHGGKIAFDRRAKRFAVQLVLPLREGP